MRPRSAPAHSLVELTFTLALFGVLVGLGAPPLHRALVLARLRGARDLVVLQLARARALAVARGGAELVVDRRNCRVWVQAADTALAAVAVGEPGEVRLLVDGTAGDTVRIGFDGLGIGRLASRTLRFNVAGSDEEAGLTVSSYGRVRTW